MHEPKLTAYVIKLKRASTGAETSNRWLFRCLIGQGNQRPLEDSFIFIEAFKKFIQKLDQPAMYADEHSRKCMTAHQPDLADPGVEPNIKPYVERSVIAGKVEGGSYGRRRNKTSTLDKANRSEIDAADAITDDFYFLLYTPLGSDKSVLLLQSYSDDAIDAVMKKFFKHFFYCDRQFKQPEIKKFVPEAIIDDFKRGATISNFTFSTELPGQTLLENVIQQQDRHFKVVVKVEPIENGVSYDEFDQTAGALQETFFTRFMQLGQFNKKRGFLKDARTGKTTPFEIGDDFKIEPVIQLSKYVELQGNESDFDRISEFSFQLLESIKPQIYPQDAVQER